MMLGIVGAAVSVVVDRGGVCWLCGAVEFGKVYVPVVWGTISCRVGWDCRDCSTPSRYVVAKEL